MRAEKVLSRILSVSKSRWTPNRRDVFKSLIRTILSQNTNWKNEEMAYQRLEERIGITPQKLSEACLDEIADAIKPAGMYKQRSRILKQISNQIIELYNGDITQIISKSYSEARSELMTLPGVGEKTADVVLLFNGGKEVLPVDRHITRISKRLEFVLKNADYDDIRLTLETAVEPNDYLDAHISLIQFGRDTCRALNPKCQICILRDLCPYPEKRAGNKLQLPKQAFPERKKRKQA
jgi:endonuclease-3